MKRLGQFIGQMTEGWNTNSSNVIVLIPIHGALASFQKRYAELFQILSDKMADSFSSFISYKLDDEERTNIIRSFSHRVRIDEFDTFAKMYTDNIFDLVKRKKRKNENNIFFIIAPEDDVRDYIFLLSKGNISFLNENLKDLIVTTSSDEIIDIPAGGFWFVRLEGDTVVDIGNYYKIGDMTKELV